MHKGHFGLFWRYVMVLGDIQTNKKVMEQYKPQVLVNT